MRRFVLRRRVRTVAMAGVGTALAAVVLSGCTLTGGGWMLSSTSSGKATFGFNLTCDENGNLTGDWTYHDKAAGVDVSGFIPAEAEVPCEEGTPGGIVEIPTPYQAQHCKEADPNDCFGVALITVDDSNTGGEPPKGDLLSIQLSGGPFDGYSNVNLVLGGNLVATNTQ